MPVNQVSTYREFKNVLLDEGPEGSDYEKHEKKYVFVDFFAEWCGPCRRFAPVLDKLSETYGKNVYYLKVDIDEVEEVASEYEISSLPTFMVFETGSLETQYSKIIGASREAVENKLKQLEAGPVDVANDDF
jgi:thioredoxin 1